MNDEMVIENSLSAEGVRRVHVMAAMDLTPRPPSLEERGSVAGIEIAEWAEVRAWEDEIRLHHLTATWRAREAVMLDFSLWGDGEREAVMWAVDPTPGPSPFASAANGEGRKPKISEAAVEAALAFYAAFGYWPSAAWVRRWPKGLTEEKAFIPITEDCGMDLFAVSWAAEGFVVVGGGFRRRREEAV